MEYEPLAEGDRSRLAEILNASFHVPGMRAEQWIERQGLEVCRVIRRGHELLGGLMILDMAQFFGGRSLPMGGISAVGVAPEARGGGAASRLMAGAIQELHQRQIPLSALYPATQTLYRKSGFEQAGARAEFRLNLRVGPVQERDLPLVKLPRERKMLEKVYRSWARPQQGALDRTETNWRRVLNPRDEPAEVYGVGEPLEGYVVVHRQAGSQPGWQNLALTDFVALTPRAARRIFSFLADHRSLAEQAVWFGAPHQPLLTVLAEQSVETRINIFWMLRLVDVPAALRGRGYSPHLKCAFKLAVDDPLLAANRGSWWVRIEAGRAEVEKARSGGLRVSERALACLYAGLLNPWQARLAGLVDWPDRDLSALEGVFGGPAGLGDMF